MCVVVYLYCTGECVCVWCTLLSYVCVVHMWCICTVRVSICGEVYTVVMRVWCICGVFVLYG